MEAGLSWPNHKHITLLRAIYRKSDTYTYISSRKENERIEAWAQDPRDRFIHIVGSSSTENFPVLEGAHRAARLVWMHAIPLLAIFTKTFGRELRLLEDGLLGWRCGRLRSPKQGSMARCQQFEIEFSLSRD